MSMLDFVCAGRKLDSFFEPVFQRPKFLASRVAHHGDNGLSATDVLLKCDIILQNLLQQTKEFQSGKNLLEVDFGECGGGGGGSDGGGGGSYGGSNEGLIPYVWMTFFGTHSYHITAQPHP